MTQQEQEQKERRPEPASLKWVARFVESANRALFQELTSWELREQVDPLKWHLILAKKTKWSKAEAQGIREQLKEWSEFNDAIYQRYTYQNYEFRAILFIRYLQPEKNLSPYEDNKKKGLFRRR